MSNIRRVLRLIWKIKKYETDETASKLMEGRSISGSYRKQKKEKERIHNERAMKKKCDNCNLGK